MKKRETGKFRKLLLKERDRVTEEMHREEMTLHRSQKDSSGDLSGYALHMADVGTDAYEREFTGNMLTNEQKTVFEIDEALMRIKDGTYGICQKCNKDIAKSHLELVPYAAMCKKCIRETEGK